MDELKPCPFCGASAVNVSGGDGRIYWFEHPINECLLSGHEFDCGNDGKWLEQWNRRHPAPGQVPDGWRLVPVDVLSEYPGAVYHSEYDGSTITCCTGCDRQANAFGTIEHADYCPNEKIRVMLAAPTAQETATPEARDE